MFQAASPEQEVEGLKIKIRSLEARNADRVKAHQTQLEDAKKARALADSAEEERNNATKETNRRKEALDEAFWAAVSEPAHSDHVDRLRRNLNIASGLGIAVFTLGVPNSALGITWKIQPSETAVLPLLVAVILLQAVTFHWRAREGLEAWRVRSSKALEKSLDSSRNQKVAEDRSTTIASRHRVAVWIGHRLPLAIAAISVLMIVGKIILTG